MNGSGSASVAAPLGGAPPRDSRVWTALGLVVAGLLAVGAGVAAGIGTPEAALLLALAAGLGLAVVAALRPFAGLWMITASSVMFLVWTLPSGKALNAFDVLQWALIAGAWFGPERRLAAAQAPAGPDHDAIRRATRAMTTAVLVFFALAAVSLAPMVLRGQTEYAVGSGLLLLRALQGAVLFPIALVLVRDLRRWSRLRAALLAGGLLFAVVNTLAVASSGELRAGVIWFLNEPLWSIGAPNDAGTTILLLWAVVTAWQVAQPRAWKVLMLLVLLALLVMTRSRSGLLAVAAFFLLTLRQGHSRWVLLLLIAAAALAWLVPQEYWTRLLRTATAERGTFDAYSALVRLYAWHTSFQVFLMHPIFGIGYRGFTWVSDQYNPLGAVLHTSENAFLETATGMGVIGLAALIVMLARMFQLGREVRRRSAPGTVGAAMGRLHVPFMIALLIPNLTGDNLLSIFGVAQLAIWLAALTSAGHLSVAGRAQQPAPAVAARPESASTANETRDKRFD